MPLPRPARPRPAAAPADPLAVPRQIVAIGGDGFAPELVDYILGLTSARRPKVCFLSTASGDAAEYVMEFYEAFTSDRCEPSHLALFGRPARMHNPRSRLLSQDVIFVGGGNTANMLSVWRRHGIDGILRGAWDAGIVLCGSSAGSICWFEGGVSDSFGAALAPLNEGLGFLPGSHCPHFDGEADRAPVYRRCIRDGLLPAGFAADDGVGLHFVGTELRAVASSRPGATAYRVWREGDGVRIEGLVRETVYVGA
jgi:peptidase E